MLDECYLVKTIDVVLKCDDNNSSNTTNVNLVPNIEYCQNDTEHGNF